MISGTILALGSHVHLMLRQCQQQVLVWMGNELARTILTDNCKRSPTQMKSSIRLFIEQMNRNLEGWYLEAEHYHESYIHVLLCIYTCFCKFFAAHNGCLWLAPINITRRLPLSKPQLPAEQSSVSWKKWALSCGPPRRLLSIVRVLLCKGTYPPKVNQW